MPIAEKALTERKLGPMLAGLWNGEGEVQKAFQEEGRAGTN